MSPEEKQSMAQIMTTLALLNAELKRTVTDLTAFRKELTETREDVILLKASQDRNWTPKALTALVAGIISATGVATASIITAMKWLAL